MKIRPYDMIVLTSEKGQRTKNAFKCYAVVSNHNYIEKEREIMAEADGEMRFVLIEQDTQSMVYEEIDYVG